MLAPNNCTIVEPSIGPPTGILPTARATNTCEVAVMI